MCAEKGGVVNDELRQVLATCTRNLVVLGLNVCADAWVPDVVRTVALPIHLLQTASYCGVDGARLANDFGCEVVDLACSF